MCQSNMTALRRGTASLFPGYRCNSPVAPIDFDRLVSVYRLIQTVFLRDEIKARTGGEKGWRLRPRHV